MDNHMEMSRVCKYDARAEWRSFATYAPLKRVGGSLWNLKTDCYKLAMLTQKSHVLVLGDKL